MGPRPASTGSHRIAARPTDATPRLAGESITTSHARLTPSDPARRATHSPPPLSRSVSAAALASQPRVSRPARQQQWVQRVHSSRPSRRHAASWTTVSPPYNFFRLVLPPSLLHLSAASLLPFRSCPTLLPRRPPASIFDLLRPINFSSSVSRRFAPSFWRMKTLSRFFIPILRCHFALRSQSPSPFLRSSRNAFAFYFYSFSFTSALPSLSPCLMCLVRPWELRVFLSLEALLSSFVLRLLSLLLLPPSPLSSTSTALASLPPFGPPWPAPLGPSGLFPSPTYYNRVVKEKWSSLSLLTPGPLRSLANDVLRRVRETAGGDHLPSSCPPSTNTASLTAFNCILNAVVSENAVFGSLDLVDFYLGTPLLSPQFIKIFVDSYPPEVLSSLSLLPFIKVDSSGKRYCLFRIDKTMYGLKEAGQLSNRRLVSLLSSFGFLETSTPCLFRHLTRPISFVLVVDDFGESTSISLSLPCWLLSEGGSQRPSEPRTHLFPSRISCATLCVTLFLRGNEKVEVFLIVRSNVRDRVFRNPP